jgi:ParB-like nuclease domain
MLKTVLIKEIRFTRHLFEEHQIGHLFLLMTNGVKLRPPTVKKKPDGFYHLTDGNHRVRAAMLHHLKEIEVWVEN